jgi:hypothetical protein
VILSTEAYTFTPGDEFEAQVLNSLTAPVTVFAQARDEHTVLMPLAAINESAAYLQQSEMLTFALNPKFSLAVATPRIREALDAAKACLVKYSAPG